MRDTVPAVRPDGTREQQQEFVRLLRDKLEVVRRKRETEEKLTRTLRQLSEATAPSKPQKARKAAAQAAEALQKYPEPEVQDEDILDEHMAHIGWDDSAKQSPHRSPGLGPGAAAALLMPPCCPLPSGARRRSPGTEPSRLRCQHAAGRRRPAHTPQNRFVFPSLVCRERAFQV